jgi:hypothetical protein
MQLGLVDLSLENDPRITSGFFLLETRAAALVCLATRGCLPLAADIRELMNSSKFLSRLSRSMRSAITTI